MIRKQRPASLADAPVYLLLNGVRMDAFKEFQGKDLDTAIEEACSYFNVGRDQLEIEIVRDAKTGIFGIVGTRKAAIRARRVHLEKAAPFIPNMKLGFELAPHKPKLPALRSDGEVALKDALRTGEHFAQARQPEKTAEEAVTKKADLSETRKEPAKDGPMNLKETDPLPAKEKSTSREERQVPDESGEMPPVQPETEPVKSETGHVTHDTKRSQGHERKSSRHFGRKKKGVEGKVNEGQPDARKSPERGEPKDAHHKNSSRRPLDGKDNESKLSGRKDNGHKESDHKEVEKESEKKSGRKVSDRKQTGRDSSHRSPKRPRQQRQAPVRDDIDFHFSDKDISSFVMADATYDFSDMPEEIPEGLPLISKEQISSPEFREKLETILMNIIEPIIGVRVDLQFEIYQNSVRVHIDSGDHSGLLIGREGQTLIAIQYLTSRILTHMLGAAVRLQLDAGEYRQRQEDKLNDIALSLADRARQTGRSFSTRPLSSYHRRIIHMSLQDATDIQTRSIGEGSMKRVIISCRREKENGKAES